MEALTTHGITVRAKAQYLPEQSNPRQGRFVFGYHISIENGSKHTVQLLSRRWVIKNAAGMVRVVEGLGVVGRQPVLAPGEAHQYASYCELNTDLGSMVGTYLMKRLDTQELFDVRIPQFLLVIPAKWN